MPRHYGNLDAQLIPTAGLLLIEKEVKAVIEQQKIGLYTGDSRVGKDFAIEHACEQAGKPVTDWLVVSFAQGPLAMDVARALWEPLTGDPVPVKTGSHKLLAQVAEIQAREHRPVWVQEAQHWERSGLGALRQIHDQSGEAFPLIMSGAEDFERKLRRYPCLAHRALSDKRIEQMTLKETLKALPTYHPLYRDADPRVLAMVYANRCRGLLGMWATFTLRARQHPSRPTTLTDRIARDLLRGDRERDR